MPDYWLDADSLIVANRGPYRFGIVDQFWDFLEYKAIEGVIGSPDIILTVELTSNSTGEDQLQKWARALDGVLFIAADASVQSMYSRVVNYVQNCGKYKQNWISKFLSGADPWVIAYPIALGGKVVTFEKPEPKAKRPKIPDVSQIFGISCINLYDMLSELGFKA